MKNFVAMAVLAFLAAGSAVAQCSATDKAALESLTEPGAMQMSTVTVQP